MAFRFQSEYMPKVGRDPAHDLIFENFDSCDIAPSHVTSSGSSSS